VETVKEDDLHTAIIIDPCCSMEAIELLTERRIERIIILLTHEHFDHISGVNQLRDTFGANCRVICSKVCGEKIQTPEGNLARFWEIMIASLPEDKKEQCRQVADLEYRCQADEMFDEGYKINWNGRYIHLEVAPGHAKGGCHIQIDAEIVFTGDNLVNGNGVICRWPGGSKKEYLEITRPKLEALGEELLICPGHGEMARLPELRQYMEMFKR